MSFTFTIVQVTTLPSDDVEMKFKLPSRSFFCHVTFNLINMIVANAVTTQVYNTCHTGSLCLPVLAVERKVGTLSLSCKLYTTTEPVGMKPFPLTNEEQILITIIESSCK